MTNDARDRRTSTLNRGATMEEISAYCSVCYGRSGKEDPKVKAAESLKTRLFLAIVVVLFTQLSVSAADVLPPVQIPEKGSRSRPETTPEQPPDPGTPPIPPSTIDPGIE